MAVGCAGRKLEIGRSPTMTHRNPWRPPLSRFCEVIARPGPCLDKSAIRERLGIPPVASFSLFATIVFQRGANSITIMELRGDSDIKMAIIHMAFQMTGGSLRNAQPKPFCAPLQTWKAVF
jgi:hypothetical protein